MSERNIKIIPDYELRIKRTSNGYILSSLEENEDSTYSVNREVVEDTDNIDFVDGLEDLKCTDVNPDEIGMYNLLQAVKEFFGIFYNKYKSNNLVVKFEGNDELEQKN